MQTGEDSDDSDDDAVEQFTSDGTGAVVIPTDEAFGTASPLSQTEAAGLEALRHLPETTQVEALTRFNIMSAKLRQQLKVSLDGAALCGTVLSKVLVTCSWMCADVVGVTLHTAIRGRGPSGG